MANHSEANKSMATTLLRWQGETVLAPEKTVVLIAPALTKKRYLSERKKTSLFDRWRKKEFDFVKRQVFCTTWEAYHKMVVVPLKPALVSLKTTYSGKILLDARWNDFKAVASDPQIQFIAMVAHHAELSGQKDAVEFASGCKPFSEITGFLKNLKRTAPVSIAWFTCESGELKKVLSATTPSIGSQAWASWNLPLTQSLEFVGLWVGNLDGRKTLSEAWQMALEKIIHPIRLT